MALSNTTLGVLVVTIDATIMIIAMPDIFRGIKLDPLSPGNSFYLLWMILSYLIVSSVLVVSLGRLGDIFGRVRIYNLGFVVYTSGSILLSVTWLTGQSGALWLILMRVVQGVGGAFLIANSAAILTDAFPEHQRGLALGINNVAGISGSFIGLVLGGILGSIDWRLVFLVSVPVGLAGTVWSYLKLRELGVRRRTQIDWLGNLTFAVGLILVMIGVTYGIEPYGRESMAWTSPSVLTELGLGAALLAAFCIVEQRVPAPMFRMGLFKIRAFVFGTISSFLSALGRGGLMFMMVIWLQGIWLPLHGFSFATTPLWAGIYMMPLTAGFLLAGPASGALSDRFGARPFATGGMLTAALSFVLLEILPIDFSYALFAPLLLLNGLGMGAFASPNRAGVMNSLPPEHRGAGGGMNSTFQNSAQVLSIGIFFTLVIVGLSGALSQSLDHGLIAHGVPQAAAARASSLPPVSTLFAAFLGYNPMQHLLGASTLAALPQHTVRLLTGRSFFPDLISAPFAAGLHVAFDFSIGCCLVAAAASWSRGKRYVYRSRPAPAGNMAEAAAVQDNP
ncbi:MAG: MFS transporter [Candidatus Dormibacteria bacterium]